MARIRSIKPEFCTSQSVGRLSRPARLFFLELLTEADDEGRFIDAPKRLAGDLFPWDDDVGPADVEGWLDELVDEAIVVRYATESGRFGAFVNWSRHQQISHRSASRLPAPSDFATSDEVEKSVSGEAPESLRKGSGDRPASRGSTFAAPVEAPKMDGGLALDPYHEPSVQLLPTNATSPVEIPQPMSQTTPEQRSCNPPESLRKVAGDRPEGLGQTAGPEVGSRKLKTFPPYPPNAGSHDVALARSAPPAASPERAITATQLRPAVLAACGLHGPLTSSELRSANLAIQELRRVGAQPADVHERAGRYRSRWPDVVLTPKALAKHWATLAADTPTNGREYPPLRVVDYPEPTPEIFNRGVESCRAALAKGEER